VSQRLSLDLVFLQISTPNRRKRVSGKKTSHQVKD